MNVACAVSSMSGDFRKWFKDLSIIEHENNTPGDLDLLILTGGGADISPERYREGFNGSHGVDPERDDREFSILDKVIKKNPNINVLGVCRGLQLMNVYFGGTLYQDLDSMGVGHGRVHSLVFDGNSPFSWLTRVNSLHHQAVRHIGSNGSFYPYILAKEPVTNIPEIVTFGNKLLGVQFHPEMFTGNIGDRFFSIINDWVTYGLSLSEPIIEEDLDEEDLDEETPDEEIQEENNDFIANPTFTINNDRLRNLYREISLISNRNIPSIGIEDETVNA